MIEGGGVGSYSREWSVRLTPLETGESGGVVKRFDFRWLR